MRIRCEVIGIEQNGKIYSDKMEKRRWMKVRKREKRTFRKRKMRNKEQRRKEESEEGR